MSAERRARREETISAENASETRIKNDGNALAKLQELMTVANQYTELTDNNSLTTVTIPNQRCAVSEELRVHFS